MHFYFIFAIEYTNSICFFDIFQSFYNFCNYSANDMEAWQPKQVHKKPSKEKSSDGFLYLQNDYTIYITLYTLYFTLL